MSAATVDRLYARDLRVGMEVSALVGGERSTVTLWAQHPRPGYWWAQRPAGSSDFVAVSIYSMRRAS